MGGQIFRHPQSLETMVRENARKKAVGASRGMEYCKGSQGIQW